MIMSKRNKAALAAMAVIAIIVSIIVVLGGKQSASADRPMPCGPGTGWVEEKHHPEVVEKELVFDYWQRYSWTGGPVEGEPPFPSEHWQPNVQGDPHGIGVEGAYFRSHGNSGNGDWFYLRAIDKIVNTIVEEAWTEYITHPDRVCPDSPPVLPEIPRGGEKKDVSKKPAAIQHPKKGEVVVSQTFDGGGRLIEQKVAKPIDTDAKQEGM